VVNGVLYWGAWDGYEYAMDLQGNVLWKTFLGITAPTNQACRPRSAGVASPATVANVPINGTQTEVVFVGGGDAKFYALDASNGHILWSTPLGTQPKYMIWAAAAVYKGAVYVGVSSYGDCPLVPGKVVQMDASTGTILHAFQTVPAHCVGGGVWVAPAIDQAHNTLYVTTGTIASCSPPETMAYAIVELKTTDLSYVDSWQIPVSQQEGDGDFGSTPTLFSATIKGVVHEMVGAVNKNGIYYALDRDNLSAGPLWEDQISTVPTGSRNSIASSAWDGTTLYVADSVTTIGGQSCNGSIRAVNPADGSYIWQYCAPGGIVGALTAVPGLVIAGAGKYIVVVDATNGHLLREFHDGFSTSFFWGGPTVSNGALYMGNKDGMLYAIGV
jgi:polyvinyl alcohol dehydrogenase (cytochrome)